MWIELMNSPDCTFLDRIQRICVIDGPFYQGSRPMGRRNWFGALLHDLPVTKMTAFNSLSAKSVLWTEYRSHWQGEYSVELLAILKRLRTLDLEDWEFDGHFTVLMRLISHATSLEKLQLTGIYCDGADDPEVFARFNSNPMTAPPASLSVLEIYEHVDKVPFLEWFTSRPSMPSIRTVIFHGVTRQECSTVSGFLRQLGSVLQHLTFGYCMSPGGNISLLISRYPLTT
ncbi:hypothetical protein B0H10DRAFT_916264 [Mycena sp. CBHHK59/15]|nr:hypothetical protein B0H10DRAFT_916264 [Mycena sp. CBHHK59/15]